ncbi:MAG TPA: hypothetical protein VN671_08940 [Solirubrobacterales bacterium]|nr:hypothetical protein [Solirubrobacterales bacterium]
MNDNGLTELVYEDFVMRLDGPMIEVMGSSFKGLFRLHVNFAQASLTPKKHDTLEVYVDDGGGLDRPFQQEKIQGVWGLWRFVVPVTEESAFVDFFAEAERRRTAPRATVPQ